MVFFHRPVMVEEVLNGLKIMPDGIYVDCTLGGGGHSEAVLKGLGSGGRLVALDQDSEAIAAAGKRLAPFRDKVILVRENFTQLPEVLKRLGIRSVDGIIFDLGVSSYQLDNPARGFSYQYDAPLDMRMDQKHGKTAREIVNNLPVAELAAMIRNYGEERWASRIAQFIGEARERRTIETTGQLVEIIKKAIPAGARRKGPHPAKRTFQALRIAVNRELEILNDSICSAVRVLRPGGRICVITFHSLEDRVVKDLLRRMAAPCSCPRELPVCVCGGKKEVRLITAKPLLPCETELEENPRARSAKLRIAERLE